MESPRTCRRRARGLHCLLLLAAAGCASPKAAPPTVTPVARGDATEMVVTAHPLASEVGLAMLRRGGAPIDAAVAAQAMLGLVEPQESGPAGGGVLLTWRAANNELAVFDGTPRAGANAARGLNADDRGRPLDPGAVMYGANAVAVPGIMPALAAAHAAQGRLPWADLFQPAIARAESGYPLPRALHDLLSADADHLYAPVLTALGLAEPPPPLGAPVRNPAYAETLRRIARLGPAGLYADAAGAELADALATGPRPSRLTETDFAGFQPARPEPLCLAWRNRKLCTAPPPGYGGLLALQILAMAGPGDLADAGYAHRFLEAGRLAQADRRRWIADPDAVDVPVRALMQPAYLAARAAMIGERAMSRPKPGTPEPDEDSRSDDPGRPTTATSQIVVVDRVGNALTMTTSLTHTFGARVAFGGMALNNALTGFSPAPPSGVHYANEMAPNKRPVTPMAPVMVFDGAGRLVLLGGSGGGPFVPDVVAAAVLDMLAGLPPAEALARPHISAAETDHVVIEAGTLAESLMPALAALGHMVEAEPMPSGSAFLQRTATGWRGAADPRRDGVALGD